MGRTAGRGYSIFTRIYVGWFVRTGPPGQTKNDTDMKFVEKPEL